MAQSLTKVKMILGDEVFQVLKDVATVEAARAQKAATGAAVGGLVGGSIVSRMLRHMVDLQIGTAVQIGWYRGLAALFQAPGFRQWLTSGVKIPDRGKRVAALQVALPQISEVLTQELGDDSATVKAMMAFFRQLGGGGDTE